MEPSFSEVTSISGDGSTVIGRSVSESGVEGFIWDEINGIRSLFEVFTDSGVDFQGFSTLNPLDISDDGLTIVGNGTNGDGETEAWVATLPANDVPQLNFGTTERDEIEPDGEWNILFAGAGEDLVDSSIGKGNNRIYGGAGNDYFFNGNGDRLIGGDGDDRFFMAGESGDSTITGGLGEDQFWIASSEVPGELNTVTDFEAGIDIIGIGVIGATFQDLTFTQDEADTIISFGGNDLAKLLRVGVEILNNSDNFIFS